MGRQKAGNMRLVRDDSDDETLPAEETVRTSHFSLNDDGRLHRHSQVFSVPSSSRVIPPSLDHSISNITTSEDEPNTNDDPLDAFTSLDPQYEQYIEQTSPFRGPRPKMPSDMPMKEWLEDREAFLSEFLRLEGRGDYRDFHECPECQNLDAEPRYRCTECDGFALVCKGCIVWQHKLNGLHWIEEWDDAEGCFFRVSLKSLGHRFQLGHPIREQCRLPDSTHGKTFTVLHTNGIHDVHVDFCGCETAKPHYIQLLRFGWYPATTKFPKTASTLPVLKFFQMLSFQSKASALEFYSTLARLTDNTGTNTPPLRYTPFMRSIRQYRHLKMLKRSGRGHSRSGAAGTRQGECAVCCPACPQRFNLPLRWKECSPEQRFLYTLFLAIDANFRLKRKMVSSTASDPSLSHGWAYFVNDNGYKEFLDEFGKLIIQETSKCSNHDAVNKERGKEGLAASGVGTIDCSRHDMKRPISVGDLQKGERYVNMDYLFFSSIRDTDLIELVVSYDIACQWSVKIWDRMNQYPRWMHVDGENTKTFRFLIPKFHLPAHVRSCQSTFSFNFNPKVGRTDGEGVERGWSNINPVSASTREMGPGSRRDTLDDHFGDWNWKKVTLFGSLLLRRIEAAVPEMVEHTALHEQFSNGLDKADFESFQNELDAWEQDHSKPNPFETRVKALSLSAVRNELAEKEEEDLQKGSAYAMHEDVSASQLISMGIELEDQQRRLANETSSLSGHATDDQKAKLKLKSNTLRRKIDAWIDIQHMYVPSLRLVRSRAAENGTGQQHDTPPQSIPLYLPSALQRSTECDLRLQNIEWKLRYSESLDALDDLREALRLRSYLFIDKTRFQRGQKANTRSRGVISRCEDKISLASSRYRAARDALAALSSTLGMVGWDETLQVLRQEDIRALPVDDGKSHKTSGQKRKRNDSENGQVVSEGRRTVSWIWMAASTTESEGLHDSIRIEWCKSRARKDRWAEEVKLLLEEMRRVLVTLEFWSNEWKERGDSALGWSLPGVGMDRGIDEGRQGYARQQARQFQQMRQYCSDLWCNVGPYVNSGGQGVALFSSHTENTED